MKNIILILRIIFIFGLMNIPFGASAQTVSTVKGTKVLLDLGGESWSAGDRVFAVDGNGMKKALLLIKQTKNGKAVSEVIKGSPVSGMSLIMGKKAGSSSGSSSGAPVSRVMRTKSAYGFTGSMMMNTMKISNYRSNSFDMAGTSFGGGMFYDYPLSSEWFARGNGTLEMFEVSKKRTDNLCSGGTSGNCNAKFTQVGFYGTFNYVFSPSPYRFWAGGGGGAMVYLAKSSTVLDTNKFFFNTVLMGAAGIDIFSSRNTFFPISFEYQLIPDKEAGVTSMVIRGGWGKTF